jgi:hypothetical protein
MVVGRDVRTQAPRRRARVVWRNELSTLPQYARLLRAVERLSEPVTTADLREYTGIRDRNGLSGALFMLEALGYVYAIRGSRKALIWHPGRRHGERPQKLPDLLPYQRIPKLLKYFGRTPVGTTRVMEDVWFEGRHGQHERVLGALKTLHILGYVAYDESAPGWYWTSAKRRRPYMQSIFGAPGIQVPYDEKEVGRVTADRDMGTARKRGERGAPAD